MPSWSRALGSEPNLNKMAKIVKWICKKINKWISNRFDPESSLLEFQCESLTQSPLNVIHRWLLSIHVHFSVLGNSCYARTAVQPPVDWQFQQEITAKVGVEEPFYKSSRAFVSSGYTLTAYTEGTIRMKLAWQSGISPLSIVFFYFSIRTSQSITYICLLWLLLILHLSNPCLSTRLLLSMSFVLFLLSMSYQFSLPALPLDCTFIRSCTLIADLAAIKSGVSP